MAMTVRYTVFDGEILSETRNGVKRDYVPDPLGSTIALLDSSQTKTDTLDYWPYGEVRARTGTTATPFQFGGTRQQYWAAASRGYAAGASYAAQPARWMTPGLNAELATGSAYGFAGNAPARSLYAPRPQKYPGCSKFTSDRLDQVLAKLCSAFPVGISLLCPWECLAGCKTRPVSTAEAGRELGCLTAWCRRPKISCVSACDPPNACMVSSHPKSPNCRVNICPAWFTNPLCRSFHRVGSEDDLADWVFMLLHELHHCCGGARGIPIVTPEHQSCDEVGFCITNNCLGLPLDPGRECATGYTFPGDIFRERPPAP